MPRAADAVARVVTHVHQGAIDVLGPVVDPVTVHQSKFSMGTVLALVARFGHAGLPEFEQHFRDAETLRFRDKVEMVLDPEVDAAYPRRWIGKVTVQTVDGRVLHGRVDEPAAIRATRSAATSSRPRRCSSRRSAAARPRPRCARPWSGFWHVAHWPRVGDLLP
jgi:2-methylcitrate dehydratase PrpD